MRQFICGLAIAAVLGTAGTATTFAQNKLNFDTLPGITASPKDLPGVNLNRGQQLEPADNCSESRYHSTTKTGLPETGTVTECDYGNLSLRTFRQGDGSAASNTFPTPGPLIDNGPPPGSGGYAPKQRW